MEELNRELETQKKRDYYHLLLPELEENKLDDLIRTKYAAPLNIPDIGAPGGAPVVGGPAPVQGPIPMPNSGPMPVEEEPKEKKMSKKEMEELLTDLTDTVNNLDLSHKIMQAKQDILDEVAKELKTYRAELDEFLHKKTPQRKFFDTGGAYKENLYTMVTSLLDEVMPYLFDALPDYSPIATQISKTYDDGTVENAMVAVKVMIDFQSYKYDFKVDVPILNGIIQSPVYMQRGIKIIPLTREAIDAELSSISYRKVDPDSSYEKKTMFNNIGENPLRRHDNQKFYETDSQYPAATGLPPRSTWDATRGRS